MSGKRGNEPQKPMLIVVTEDDLIRGIIGETCPILRAMNRAMGRNLTTPAPFDWHRVQPFRFTINIKSLPKR